LNSKLLPGEYNKAKGALLFLKDFMSQANEKETKARFGKVLFAFDDIMHVRSKLMKKGSSEKKVQVKELSEGLREIKEAMNKLGINEVRLKQQRANRFVRSEEVVASNLKEEEEEEDGRENGETPISKP